MVSLSQERGNFIHGLMKGADSLPKFTTFKVCKLSDLSGFTPRHYLED